MKTQSNSIMTIKINSDLLVLVPRLPAGTLVFKCYLFQIEQSVSKTLFCFAFHCLVFGLNTSPHYCTAGNKTL